MKKLQPAYKNFLRLLSIIMFLTLSFASFSQSEKKIKKDVSGDVHIRTSLQIEKYLNDDTYLYDTEPTISPKTLWQRIWFWIMSIFSEFLYRISQGGNLIAYIFYGIMLFLLGFVILKLIGLSPHHIFLNTKKIKLSDIPVFNDDINTLDIEKTISEAINNDDFRTAVRFLYIKLLKILSEKEYIEWKPEKTNKDYYFEMQKNKQTKQFVKLTRIYEYVWYGEFLIKQNFFFSAKENFDRFFKELNA